MPLRTLLGGKLASLIRSGSFFIFSISVVGISGFTSCCTRLGQRVEILGAQRLVDPPIAAERIDRDGDVGAFDVLEEQRLPAELAGDVRSRSLCPCGAGVLQTRSQISAISRIGSTCVFTRESSPSRSSSCKKSEKVGVPIDSDPSRSNA